MQFSPCSFKVLYGRLKDLKTEIEHVQHLLEKAKVQLQKDFDDWWKQQANQVRCLGMYIAFSLYFKFPPKLC